MLLRRAGQEYHGRRYLNKSGLNWHKARWDVLAKSSASGLRSFEAWPLEKVESMTPRTKPRSPEATHMLRHHLLAAGDNDPSSWQTEEFLGEFGKKTAVLSRSHLCPRHPCGLPTTVTRPPALFIHIQAAIRPHGVLKLHGRSTRLLGQLWATGCIAHAQLYSPESQRTAIWYINQPMEPRGARRNHERHG